MCFHVIGAFSELLKSLGEIYPKNKLNIAKLIELYLLLAL